MLRTYWKISLLVVIATWVSSCSEAPTSAGDTPPARSGRGHAHEPPNGGVPVVLGDELFHLEFVRNPMQGMMDVFILDEHMDRFIRLPVMSFEVLAKLPGGDTNLTFNAIASPATGETVGDTALFRAEAEWLKTTAEFDAEIVSIEIRSNEFVKVPFRYPDGNDAGR